MEKFLESLAVELATLGVKDSKAKFRLGCDKSGIYVDVYKINGRDDRDVIKVMSHYTIFNPTVLVVTEDLVSFKLTTDLDLGLHVRSVGLTKTGDSYIAYTALELNNETLDITNKIIAREINASYELSHVIGDKVLINIRGVDVSYAFKDI